MTRTARSRVGLVAAVVVVLGAGAFFVVPQKGPDTRKPGERPTVVQPYSDIASSGGFLGLDGTSVLFVEWTRAGESLIGSVDSFHGGGGPGGRHEPLSGTMTGRSVILVVGATTWTGTLTGDRPDRLLLRRQTPDGGFRRMELVEADAADYDAAVARL